VERHQHRQQQKNPKKMQMNRAVKTNRAKKGWKMNRVWARAVMAECQECQ
jgi:hypothetical protein